MGAEFVVASLIIGAGFLVLARLRSARLSGDDTEIPPFALGIYRGCTFVIIVFALFAVGSIALGWITNQP